MNTNARTAFTRLGAGAGVVALGAALTLGAASSASAAGLAPVAASDSYAVTANATVAVSAGSGVLVNDTDAEGDPLVVGTGALPPAGGLLPGESMGLWADGHFFYTPPTGFTGTRTFTYNAFDGSASSNWAGIVFTITAPAPAPNTAPVSGSDGYAVTQDVVFSLGAPGVLGNDSDADGDAFTVDDDFEPVGGMLPGEALALDDNGSFHYVPPLGFTGTRTWTYTATDGTGIGAPADIVFTITAPVAPVNTAPVATPDAYPVTPGVQLVVPSPGLIANDTDADGDALLIDNGWEPTGGYLPGEGFALTTYDGGFGYTPPTGFTGQRVFTYTVTDGTDLSAPATLTFTITAPVAPVNTAPVANADAYVVIAKVPFTRLGAGYLENDTDADGDVLEWSNLYMPNGGLLPGEDLTMLTIGGAFTYSPPTDFTGVRQFTYLATDGTADSNYATLTFTVEPREGQPGDPLIPTEPGDPGVPTPTDDGTVPTLASTGSTPAYALGTLGVLIAATGYVLVRSSRRVA